MQNQDIPEHRDFFKADTYTLNSDGAPVSAEMFSKIPSSRSYSSSKLDEKITNLDELDQIRNPAPPKRMDSNYSNISEDFFTDQNQQEPISISSFARNMPTSAEPSKKRKKEKKVKKKKSSFSPAQSDHTLISNDNPNMSPNSPFN